MSECDHPDCTKETFGGSINGAQVCMDHIEWAMGKAFAPIHRLEEILRGDDDASSQDA